MYQLCFLFKYMAGMQRLRVGQITRQTQQTSASWRVSSRISTVLYARALHTSDGNTYGAAGPGIINGGDEQQQHPTPSQQQHLSGSSSYDGEEASTSTGIDQQQQQRQQRRRRRTKTTGAIVLDDHTAAEQLEAAKRSGGGGARRRRRSLRRLGAELIDQNSEGGGGGHDGIGWDRLAAAAPAAAAADGQGDLLPLPFASARDSAPPRLPAPAEFETGPHDGDDDGGDDDDGGAFVAPLPIGRGLGGLHVAAMLATVPLVDVVTDVLDTGTRGGGGAAAAVPADGGPGNAAAAPAVPQPLIARPAAAAGGAAAVAMHVVGGGGMAAAARRASADHPAARHEAGRRRTLRYACDADALLGDGDGNGGQSPAAAAAARQPEEQQQQQQALPPVHYSSSSISINSVEPSNSGSSSSSSSSNTFSNSSSAGAGASAGRPSDPREELLSLLLDRGIELADLPRLDESRRLVCPECAGGRSREASLSVTLKRGNAVVWHCFRATCGWTGAVRAGGGGNAAAAAAGALGGSSGSGSSSGSGADAATALWRPPDVSRLRPLSPEFAAWLRARGISKATADAHGVKTELRAIPAAGGRVPALAFPYYERGRVVNVKYRALPKHFSQSPRGLQVLYGADAVAGARAPLLVEGELDKLALYEAGVFAVASVPSGAVAPRRAAAAAAAGAGAGVAAAGTPAPPAAAPWASEEDAKFAFLRRAAPSLAAAERVVVGTDADGPGRALAWELARRLGFARCWLLPWPEGCKDANDALLALGPAGLAEWVRAAPVPMPESMHLF